MFTFSPQDKKYLKVLKQPHSKVCAPLVLNTVCGYLDDPRLFLFCGCSWIPLLVTLSTVLQKNPPFLRNLQFYSIFCIFEPFPAVTVWFWDPSFDTEDNWGTQTQLLTKGSNVHWCSLRKYDVLRDGGLNIFEFEDQGKLYLICLPGNMQVSSVAAEGQY